MFKNHKKLTKNFFSFSTAHAGTRPYPCRLCDKSYLLSHHLTRHMRSHKENSQIIHKCTECDLLFGKRDELVAHSSLHATENLVCPLCKTTFESVDDVSEHIKKHTEGEQFACEFCDLIFLTESELHDHSDTQHLEEIELYDMANTNEESLDDDFEYVSLKPESNEIVEYTEQVEVITPEELSEVTKTKPASRSYGKANAKPIFKSVKPVIKSEESSSKLTNTTIRSPNTRASVTKTTSATIEKSPEKPVSTRSSKVSPNKSISSEKKALVATTTTSVAPTKKQQTSLTKFLTIKSKSNQQSNTNAPTLKKLIPLPTLKMANKDDDKVTTTKVGNKLLKVKQIRMTKSQIEALTKQGKIEMRGNQVIIKKSNSPKKK